MDSIESSRAAPAQSACLGQTPDTRLRRCPASRMPSDVVRADTQHMDHTYPGRPPMQPQSILRTPVWPQLQPQSRLLVPCVGPMVPGTEFPPQMAYRAEPSVRQWYNPGIQLRPKGEGPGPSGLTTAIFEYEASTTRGILMVK